MSPDMLIAIELLLVFGGVLGFAAWQLRELSQLKRERLAREAEERHATGTPPPGAP
jgi:HAMP domain-containing protein